MIQFVFFSIGIDFFVVILPFVLGVGAGLLVSRHFKPKTWLNNGDVGGLKQTDIKAPSEHIESKPQEVRSLAASLNVMTKQLRDQIAHEAETRQFQSFVRLSAILTHDLKNAIEALSLTVQNMEQHFDNKEFRVDAMTSLSGATENLKALVARLSNPVNTLSGEFRRPRPVDLVPMLRLVISMTAAQSEKKHQIDINLPDSLLALVDIERMEKVIENLIINALEAMGEQRGVLTIEAGTTIEGKSYFSVGDTGPGMSPEFIEKNLFHPFVTTKRRGVGLGLYTCREVVRAHAGSIEVDSQPGIGTTFRIILPPAEKE